MSLAQSLARLRVALQAALGACGQKESELAGPGFAQQSRTDHSAPGYPIAEKLVRAVLSDIRLTNSGRHVRFDLACQPGLEVRGDPLRFQNVVTELVRHAVAQAPCGHVLVTCARRAGRLQLAVADDGAGADQETQQSELRAVGEQLAMQGGSLEIVSRRNEGSTLSAYWPDMRTGQPASTTAAPSAEPIVQEVRRTRSLIEQSD